MKGDIYEPKNNYDSDLENIDITDTEIKINPDFYIHTAILKAQQSLIDSDVKQGFLKYRVLIEHIEAICDAANMLSEDEYKKPLKEFKDELEKGKTGIDENIRNIKIAHEKFRLLMKIVLSNKTITAASKV